jgi:hypothetical protein
MSDPGLGVELGGTVFAKHTQGPGFNACTGKKFKKRSQAQNTTSYTIPFV